MTGALPFGVIRHCGCVFSEGGIRAVIQSTSNSSGSTSPKDQVSGEQASVKLDRSLPCPNCSEPFDPSEGFGSGTGSIWWLPLNPKQEHQTQMLHDLTSARAAAKAAKKASTSSSGSANKKRKSEATGDSDLTTASANKPKRVKSVPTDAAPVKLSGKVAQELAELEAKRKSAGMSDAVKSIYAGKNGGKGLGTSGNDFFTRTFNRVSRYKCFIALGTLADLGIRSICDSTLERRCRPSLLLCLDVAMLYSSPHSSLYHLAKYISGSCNHDPINPESRFHFAYKESQSTGERRHKLSYL